MVSNVNLHLHLYIADDGAGNRTHLAHQNKGHVRTFGTVGAVQARP